MSFKATLKIEDLDVNVLACEYEIMQNIDNNGRPYSKARGGNIFITLESSLDTSIFDWAASLSQTKSGKIIFLKRDSNSRMKELSFTDAYVIKKKEYYDYRGFDPMYMVLELTAKDIKLGSTVVEAAWSV